MIGSEGDDDEGRISSTDRPPWVIINPLPGQPAVGTPFEITGSTYPGQTTYHDPSNPVPLHEPLVSFTGVQVILDPAQAVEATTTDQWATWSATMSTARPGKHFVVAIGSTTNYESGLPDQPVESGQLSFAAEGWGSFSAPKGVNADTMLLLTDATVLVHNSGGNDWYRLTPDIDGQYSTINNGNWSSALRMKTGRQFFSSGVLSDGRVFVVGGEYSDAVPQDQEATGEIFDPQSNLWSPMNKPTPFDFIRGDAVSCVLADGRVLFGSLVDNRSAIWDPIKDTWIEAGLDSRTQPPAQTKKGDTNEETWAMLPNGNVLTVQITNTTMERNAEMYVPSIDQWVGAGTTTQNLVVVTIEGVSSDEIGPAILLPSGKVFAIGGNGHTEVYTPNADTLTAGTWTTGPDFPADNGKFSPAGLQTVLDGAACLLPGGRVMCIAGPTTPYDNGYWSGPPTFYIYDPTNSASPLTRMVYQPSNSGGFTFESTLLLLPNGHVLHSAEGNVLAEYGPTIAEITPNAAWKPTITTCPSAMSVGSTYTITGTQFTGLSHANSYGDDRQNATNFPLVRLSDSAGRIVYLRTFRVSTRAVATGASQVSTRVEVPLGTRTGSSALVVVANGIQSDPQQVEIQS